MISRSEADAAMEEFRILASESIDRAYDLGRSTGRKEGAILGFLAGLATAAAFGASVMTFGGW